MSICNRCGKDNPQGYKFCMGCGAFLDDQSTGGYQQPYNYPEPARAKSNTGVIIGIIIAGVVALAIIIVGLVSVILKSDNKDSRYVADKVVSDEVKPAKTQKKKTETKSATYEKGTLSSDTFVSEFIGLKYVASDPWVLSTREELEEDLKDDSSVSWEMRSINAESGSNIIIGVEKLPMANISMDSYISQFMSEVNTTLETSDFTKGTYTLDGVNFTTAEYDVQSHGVDMEQKCYFKKQDKYMICIIVTAVNGDDPDMCLDAVEMS